MRAAEPADLFDDPADPYLTYDAFDLSRVKADLERDGYSIVRKLIPGKYWQSMREFWLDRYAGGAHGRVTWAPYLGQENHVGFSADAFQHLYRACDFLWNEPMHADTREVSIRMNALRNLILGEDPSYGLRYADRRYGLFVSTSYYPPGNGFMDSHQDSVKKDAVLIHCLAPLTMQGTDYAKGGMVIVDRHGNAIDVDAQLAPGDAVYYDGSLKHGVARIEPIPGKNLGRLQFLPLPTLFRTFKNNPRALNTITAGEFIKAKWACFKNDVRIRLGFRPSLR